MNGILFSENSIYCVFVIICGLVFYIGLVDKTKDKLNPFGIVCLSWCIFGGISSLHLSWLETKWTLSMYLIILIFPILVFSCGYFTKTGKVIDDKKVYIKFSNIYISLTRILFFVSLACALIEWKNNDFLIALSSDALDAKSLVTSIPVIHYGTIYFPYCAINSLFEMAYRKKKNVKTVIYLGATIIINLFYALFIGASRGSLLIIFCALIYLLFRKYNIPFRVIFILAMGILMGFIAISNVRIFSDSLVYNVIRGHPLISSVYGYTALNFENLNKLTQRGPMYTGVLMTYGGFLQLIGMGHAFEAPEYITTHFFNANTICYDFYEDLGILGVVLYTLILFGCIKLIYCKSFADKRYLLLLIVMQKAIWMTFFGNYFTIYRVMLFPFFVTGLVIYSMNFVIDSSGKISKRKRFWEEKVE